MTTQHTPAGYMTLLSPERATERIAELKSQRDDLLAVLKRCRALLSPTFCAGDPAAEEMRLVVRAAIARVEGNT